MEENTALQTLYRAFAHLCGNLRRILFLRRGGASLWLPPLSGIDTHVVYALLSKIEGQTFHLPSPQPWVFLPVAFSFWQGQYQIFINLFFPSCMKNAGFLTNQNLRNIMEDAAGFYSPKLALSEASFCLWELLDGKERDVESDNGCRSPSRSLSYI